MSQDANPADRPASESTPAGTEGFAPAPQPAALDPASVTTVAPDGTPQGRAPVEPPLETAAEPTAASAASAGATAAASMDAAAEEDEDAQAQAEMQRQVRLATESAMQAVAASAAAQKMDALSGLVLDAAELANRAATTSTAAGHKLMETRTELEAELARARRHGKIVLGVAAGVSVVSLLLTAAIVAQMGSRMAKLDATVLAVGKRFVEVTTGLENLTVLNDTLAEVQAQQQALTQLQSKLQTGLEETNKASQGLVSQVPQATAKEVQARTQALMQQVQSIDSRVAAQGAAVKKMADEVKALQGQGENVGALKREVEALVVLQKERYLEAAKAAGVTAGSAGTKGPVVQPPPRTVQYPRPQPQGEGAQPGAAGGAPASGGAPAR